VKKSGRDEIIWVVIQHKESPCIAIFISNSQKHHVFLIIFYVFSSIKSENSRVEQVPPRGGEGKGGRERGGRMNMVQIMCTHVCKCKNDPC
jgi:hypothetical protein